MFNTIVMFICSTIFNCSYYQAHTTTRAQGQSPREKEPPATSLQVHCNSRFRELDREKQKITIVNPQLSYITMYHQFQSDITKEQNTNITDVTIDYYSLHVPNHIDQNIADTFPKTSKKDQHMVITMSKPSTTAKRDKRSKVSQIK